MKSPLDDASLARLPASGLAALVDLRGEEGVSARVEGDRAWVRWEPGDGRVLRAVLPVAGVELFERRGDAWHRPGHRLPSLGIPTMDEAILVDRLVLPGPIDPEPPPIRSIDPVPLRLARSDRPRPASAMLCPLKELVRWADSAPTSAIEAIRGAVSGGSALLVGGSLPLLAGSVRYWGRSVLVPLGFVIRPEVPEAAIREAFGASDGEIVRVVSDRPEVEAEVVPIAAIGPMSRAGVRLAGRAATP